MKKPRTDWRVHFTLDLTRLECDFFEVTDASEGETFRRVPITPGIWFWETACTARLK